MKLTKSARRVARRVGKVRSKLLVPPGPMRSAWDARLTGTQNLARVGLAPSVNDIHVTNARHHTRHEQTAAKVEQCPERLDVLEKLEKEAAVPERVSKPVVRPGEELALSRMLSRHGSDYEAMSRDIKLNYLQWTPAQLRRKCNRRERIRTESDLS
jgi:Ribosome biogenesis protein Nop16